MEEEEKAKNIVSFRGAQIPQYEVDILLELENQLGKQLEVIEKTESIMNIGFSVENNRTVKINIDNCEIPNLPESMINIRTLQTLIIENNQLDSKALSVIEQLETKNIFIAK